MSFSWLVVEGIAVDLRGYDMIRYCVESEREKICAKRWEFRYLNRPRSSRFETRKLHLSRDINRTKKLSGNT